jgi:hypothetical protein
MQPPNAVQPWNSKGMKWITREKGLYANCQRRLKTGVG